jgi:DNA-binding IclR family transcriptional regulator
MNRDKSESFYNRSLERALQILIAFSNERQSLTLAQLSKSLSLSRATVLRLCSTLIRYDFLRQDPESKLYSLGFRLFELGNIVSYSFSLRRIASPYLEQLHMKLDKTIFLGILDNDEILYVDKKENPEDPISFTSKIGTRRPPYWGMLGSALMAPLTAVTKKSITKKEEFKKWLQRIREQGYAIDVETALEGIGGVAAPIRDFTGKVVASIGVSFIASSVHSNELKKMIKEVEGTALTISKEIGYLEERQRAL